MVVTLNSHCHKILVELTLLDISDWGKRYCKATMRGLANPHKIHLEFTPSNERPYETCGSLAMSSLQVIPGEYSVSVKVTFSLIATV